MSWLSSFERVGGVSVPPGDVAADHAVLFAVCGVIGAVEGGIPQIGELGFEAGYTTGGSSRATGSGGCWPGPTAPLAPLFLSRSVSLAISRRSSSPALV